MNPPYAQPLMSQFAEKLVTELDAGNIEQAIVLVNNATETQWFQTMHRRATAVCFNKARIRFLDPEGKPGAPLQGQVFLYFGANVEGFLDEFAAHGQCVVKPSRSTVIDVKSEIVESPPAPPQAPLETTAEIELEDQPAPAVAAPTASPAPSLIETSEATLAEILALLTRLRPAEITELHRVIESRWLEGGSRP
jgi:hypothetical protein